VGSPVGPTASTIGAMARPIRDLCFSPFLYNRLSSSPAFGPSSPHNRPSSSSLLIGADPPVHPLVASPLNPIHTVSHPMWE